MRRYRNILVGVNGSKPSFHALREAIRLAQWGKGWVTVIHVALPFEGDLSLVGVKNIKAVVHGPRQQILREAVELAESHDVSIRTICDEGKAHERIAHHAIVGDADLIVLGVKRPRSIVGLLLGNVLAKLLELCPRDVLAIPDQAPIRWEKILFAFESPKCSEDKVARVIELAVIHGGDLRTLSVINSFFDSREKVKTDRECLLKRSAVECLESVHMRANRAGVANEGMLLRGRFHKVVWKYAMEKHINMIVVGTNGEMKPKWGLGRSSIGSITSRAPCPVLFLRHQQDYRLDVKRSLQSV